MKTLSIVVPVYWNEESLPLLGDRLVELERLLASRDVGLELVFVDDGSGDRSFDELLKLKQRFAKVTLVRFARNFGAVVASKHGYSHVTGDCFMSLAADLQDPPLLIAEMVDRWLAGSKFVIAVREARNDPVTSTMFSAIFYRLVRAFVIPNYPITGYDMGLMDSRAILPHLLRSGKNINIALFAYWLGFAPSVIHYEREERRHGRSRWTFRKRLKFFIDSLIGFSMTPIRMISGFGIAVSIVSVVYCLVLITNALLGRTSVPGFVTLATLISFFAGVIIAMLGIIGEYLWRIFDQTNDRPEVVIDEIVR